MNFDQDPTSSAPTSSIAALLAEAWPGSHLLEEPVPLAGGFWASMYRLRVAGQPAGVPTDLVFRVAPDAAMGAKELAVQRAVADLGYATPSVRLSRADDEAAGGSWSVMDFAAGSPPLGGLDGIAALRRVVGLLAGLPKQLAAPMAALHALDPASVTAAVAEASPTVAWQVDDLLEHFEAGATALDRPGLVAAVRQVRDRRPAPGGLVVCHGDLHPFNLLVDAAGTTTVLDWTGAILAEPAFDVAFTSLLLGNPPLQAPGPLVPILDRVGAGLARRFLAAYRSFAPASDLSPLPWYRAVHGLRVHLEMASMEVKDPEAAAHHPFTSVRPAASRAIAAVTGTDPVV